jgi:hypothetical protein
MSKDDIMPQEYYRAKLISQLANLNYLFSPDQLFEILQMTVGETATHLTHQSGESEYDFECRVLATISAKLLFENGLLRDRGDIFFFLELFSRIVREPATRKFVYESEEKTINDAIKEVFRDSVDIQFVRERYANQIVITSIYAYIGAVITANTDTTSSHYEKFAVEWNIALHRIYEETK